VKTSGDPAVSVATPAWRSSAWSTSSATRHAADAASGLAGAKVTPPSVLV
jgi:hypothetical protein